MIIHPIAKRQLGKQIELSARIEWEQNGIGTGNNEWFTPPSHLWYRFDEQDLDAISNGYNSYLASLICISMFYGEHIHVRGCVSPMLLYNLKEFQNILHFWRPEWFSLISITSDSLESSVVQPKRDGAMCSYSGGVDSTYTLWEHLPKNEPLKAFQVTDALYIRGYDTYSGFEKNIESTESKDIKQEAYTSFTQSVGVQLHVTESNLNSFQQYDSGVENCYFSWGSLVGATALLYEDTVPRFYFSADNLYDDPISHSINHQLLPLLSTEKMEIRVHGPSVLKPDKMRAIASSPEVHDKVVVCFSNPDGLRNCNQCGKCVRSAAYLDSLKLLEQFTSFPKTVNRSRLRREVYPKEFIFFHYRHRDYFFRHGYYGYAFDFQCAILLSWTAHYVQLVKNSVSYTLKLPGAYMFTVSAKLKKYSNTYERFLRIIKRV